MGKKLIIPGADFSVNGFRTGNVINVELKSGGANPYLFYFLPTAMAYDDNTGVLPTVPNDAVQKSVSEDVDVNIDGTYAAFLFGITNGMSGIITIKSLSVSYNDAITSLQKAFMNTDIETLSLAGTKLDNCSMVCAFASATIQEFIMPDKSFVATRKTFYNFNANNPDAYHTDFTFIKKIADGTSTFEYLKSKTADFTGIDVSECSNFNSMFNSCIMKEIDLSSWHFDVADAWYAGIFRSCTNLQTLHLDNWNATQDNATKNANMFTNTPVLTKVFVTNCSSTVKTWLLARLNECTAGGSSNWSETVVDGKAALTHN